MRKKWMIPLVLLCAAVGCFAYANRVNNQVVRLHVIANSDDPTDQEAKLAVRDALLQQLGAHWNTAEGVDGCLELLKADIPKVETIAKETLVRYGMDYGATAKVGVYKFPTRTYNEEVTLPGGRYEALRVELGQAEGKNWWCLLYPPLCLDAVEQAPAVDGISSAQTPDVLIPSGETETPKVHSWIWDKVQQWLE